MADRLRQAMFTNSLNRVTSRSYANDPNSTPAVSYVYDSRSITNGKGRLAIGEFQRIEVRYGNYDGAGRVSSASETIYGQTTSDVYAELRLWNLGGHVTFDDYPSGHAVTYIMTTPRAGG